MGMYVEIYRFPLGDCTNNGISSAAKRLCLVNVEGPFNPGVDAPAAMLDCHRRDCLRIVPAIEDKPGHWVKPSEHVMMGGNYGATSDSRFREACEQWLGHGFYGAVAIHDRIERDTRPRNDD